MSGLSLRLAERIRRFGPLPFDQYLEAALYDEEGGFFATGGGAGRSGSDFITSPEVGSLYGALVARALDGWWAELGAPDPFPVVEAGAGNGRLAADVLRAAPRCAGALRYVLVERSATLREAQADLLPLEPAAEALGPSFPAGPDDLSEPLPGAGPVVAALGELPARTLTGVVLANELLDNLPFRIVERSAGGWLEVRVAEGPAPVTVPAAPDLAAAADHLAGGRDLPAGTRLPVQTGVGEWLLAVSGILRRGFVCLVDYACTVDDIAAGRPWLRTYRAQARGTDPFVAPGSQDITADVVLEGLWPAAERAGFEVVAETTQAEWLRSLGVEGLVEEARAAWHGRTVTDLAAVKARSVVHEAEALLDPGGLGGHRVVVLGKAQKRR